MEIKKRSEEFYYYDLFTWLQEGKDFTILLNVLIERALWVQSSSLEDLFCLNFWFLQLNIYRSLVFGWFDSFVYLVFLVNWWELNAARIVENITIWRGGLYLFLALSHLLKKLILEQATNTNVFNSCLPILFYDSFT